MSTHKHFDRICCIVLTVTILLALLFVNGEGLGVQKASTSMGYEDRLFDTSSVHTVDIVMEDWEGFLESCTDEEYAACSVVIDGEAYENVAIRAKGNTSLTQVATYGNDRYSFKIEFDHYDSGKTYYGLDKLCLNNLIQDNTCLKDFLTYQLMAGMGVASPLCSYVNISVNGESWGLYLAVEGVEESFLQRNYGSGYGELYKPDSTSMGGGRGNGQDFEVEDWTGANREETPETGEFSRPDGGQPGGSGGSMPGEMSIGDGDFQPGEMTMDGGGSLSGGMTIGSDDVLLRYIDDDAGSYANIFDNAKTDVSAADQERLISSLKKLSEGEDIGEVVDVDSVIRYFVVHNFVLNFDSYTGSMIHNYYLYEQDGQLSMIPWDYNLAFGGFDSAGGAASLVNYPIDDPVSGGTVEDRPMLAWIFASEEYTELYHQYFAEFLSLYFDSGALTELIDETAELIAPYVEEDPTKFCTYEEFQTGVATLREFCLLRGESISGQLDGTIGSTAETQSEDTLIDPGDLDISAMGTMNNGADAGMPQSGDIQSGEEAAPTFPEQRQDGEAGTMEPPGEAGRGGEMTLPEQSGAAASNEWLWLGGSAGVLLLGLLFALLFRRENRGWLKRQKMNEQQSKN